MNFVGFSYLYVVLRTPKQMNITMKKNVISLLCSVLLLTACVNETLTIDDSYLPEGYGLLSLSLKNAEADNNIVGTRVSESQVHDLHVLIYDDSGALVIRRYYSTSLASYVIPVPDGSGYTVYAIANTGSDDTFTDDNASTMTKLESLTTSISAWNTIGTASYMLASAKATSVTVDKTRDDNECSLSLKRLAAKITINIAAASGQYVNIESFKIGNLPSKSYYVAHPLSTEDVATDVSGEAGTDATATTDTWLSIPSQTTITDNAVTGFSFYMFENRRGVNSGITAQKDKGAVNAPNNATYIEIEGETHQNKGVWRVYLGANNTSNFNIKRNTAYTYNITLTPTATDTRVTWTAQPASGGGSGTALKPANCFMVPTTGGTYNFNALMKGNGQVPFGVSGKVAAATPAPAGSNTYSAFVLWSMGGEPTDINGVVSSVSYNSTTGTINFTTTTSGSGNAVIALYDNGNQKILWSWHVWKTDYNPASDYDLYEKNSNVSSTFGSSLKVMKVYLGASYSYAQYGDLTTNRYAGLWDKQAGKTITDEIVPGQLSLMYQYGRKDPFLGGAGWTTSSNQAIASYVRNGYSWIDGTAHDVAAKPAMEAGNVSLDGASGKYVSLEYSIQYPMTFIANSAGTSACYDWLNISSVADRIDDLLGNPGPPSGWTSYNPNFGEKSLYDPCPDGWRVSPQDVFRIFTHSGGDVDYAVGTTVVWDGVNTDNTTTDFLSQKGWLFHTGNADTSDVTYYGAVGGRSNSANFSQIGELVQCMTSSPSYLINNLYTYTGHLFFNYNYGGNGAQKYHPTDYSVRSCGGNIRCCEDK
jgi:hypothetical protein